jgi:hypothetical protein
MNLQGHGDVAGTLHSLLDEGTVAHDIETLHNNNAMAKDGKSWRWSRVSLTIGA